MRIKLISPRMSLRPMDSEFKRSMSPSMALMVLASLTPKEHEVYIEDENVEKINLKDHPDLVGITVNVDTSHRAYEIAASYRVKNIPVVLGGIHPSAQPEEALKYCDAVCVGEAEYKWPEIVSDAKVHNLKPIYFDEYPTDMQIFPIPDWSKVKGNRYLYTNVICASRGCPHKCAFCYNSCEYVHHKYRNRPLSHVLYEIDQLNTKHVMFIDDNFIGNRQWTMDFAKAIKQKELTWHCAVSTEIGNHPRLMDAMAESGCQSMFIGFESINNGSVESVGKSQNKIEKYEKMIREIHDRGMMINASLAFGFDHDKADVFKNTLDWLVSNKIETMTGHILTPYPGTRLFEKLEREGRIIEYDWRKYNTSHVTFQPKHMSPEELFKGYLWIYDQFYTLKNIVKRIPEKRAQLRSYLLFNFGYRKFGRITSALGKLGMMNFIGRLARRLSYGIE